MHSRDITLLIVLLRFNIVHYSSLFQYFLLMCNDPYSSRKFQNFLRTCLLTLIIMTGEPTHTASKEGNSTMYPSYINYHLKSEVSIMLRCQLCSTRYTPVQINNCSKSTSAIKVATMKNMDDFRYEGSHHMLPPNRHFSLLAKMNGTQRRTLVSPSRMHCTYCGMPKGTSRAKATSDSEKIKPISLVVIKLSLSEGISQSGRQSVSRKFHKFL